MKKMKSAAIIFEVDNKCNVYEVVIRQKRKTMNSVVKMKIKYKFL